MKLTTNFNLIFLVISMLFLGACSNDDDTSPTPSCTELTTRATVNGDNSYTLQVAQLLTQSGDVGDNYFFNVTAIDSDCQESQTLSINVQASDNIDGTYPVVDFFSADLNMAHGSFVTQNLSTLTQTLHEIESGSIKITDNGSNNYSLNFEGTLITGDQVSFATTHTF